MIAGHAAIGSFEPLDRLIKPRRRRTTSAMRSLRILRTLIVTMAGLAGLAFAEIPGAEYIVPGTVLVTCILAAFLLLRSDTSMFWSPLLWFLLACAAYFGAGPLIYVLFSDESLRQADIVYFVDTHILNRTNALDVVSIGIVCLAYQVAWARLASAARAKFRPIPRTDASFQRRVVTVFLALGFSAKTYLWFEYLRDPNATPQGTIVAFSLLSLIALVNVAFLVRRGDRRWRWLLLVLGGYELVSAILILMKQNVLEVVISLLAGSYLARPSRRVAMLSLLGAGAIYALVLVPLVNYGRGLRERGELPGVVSLIGGTLTEVQSQNADDGQDDLSAFQRLSYTSSQAFAMNQYDIGVPGTTFDLAFYVLIPRALWPEKPIMTPGADYNYLITGNSQSAASPGVFAEAYWNGGWPFVVGACTFIGVLFAFATTVIRRHLVEELDTRWLPLALMALKLGYRPDDWFVSTFLGWVPVVGLVLVICFLVPRTRRPRFLSMGPMELPAPPHPPTSDPTGTPMRVDNG